MRQAHLLKGGFGPQAAKTITGEYGAVVMAGSDSAGATVIDKPAVVLTTASAGGARFPASEPGDFYFVKNESGNTCTLYPPTGGTINGAASLSVATAKSVVVFFSTSTACHSIPTVAS